ncbi:MAG TPA: PilN domain-containing protein [Rhizomicrobium sp.]|nr:PilN domain-containing protein [Rhizomicrobium sp.]
MNFKDLLNTDHEAIIQWLLHAFRWWTDELLGMAPTKWRDRFLKRSSVVAEFTDAGVTYRDEQSGQILPEKPRRSVKVLMPASQVLLRRIDLPVLPASDLKRMVAIDLDRLTPFKADQVLFDTEVISRDDEHGRQQVMVGVIPRQSAIRTLELSRANNIEPAALGVAAGPGTSSMLDFLPALQDAEGGSAARRRATYIWIAAGVLLAFNLFMLTYRDASATNQLREAVESQQSPVTVAMRLRDQVQKEASRRATLLRLQKQSAPLPVLDAMSQALPDGAWAEHYEWNGRTVQVRGFRKDTPDLLAKIEASPLLRNARSLSSDSRAAMATTGSFELAADREGRTR